MSSERAKPGTPPGQIDLNHHITTTSPPASNHHSLIARLPAQQCTFRGYGAADPVVSLDDPLHVLCVSTMLPAGWPPRVVAGYTLLSFAPCSLFYHAHIIRTFRRVRQHTPGHRPSFIAYLSGLSKSQIHPCSGLASATMLMLRSETPGQLWCRNRTCPWL